MNDSYLQENMEKNKSIPSSSTHGGRPYFYVKKTLFLFFTIGVSLLFLSVTACAKEEATPPSKETAKNETEKTPDASPEDVAAGADVYRQNCRVCHGIGGKGDICPNLRDKEWKYGNSDDDLYYSIAKGRPGGMPNWENTLSKEQIRKLIAFIRSIGDE